MKNLNSIIDSHCHLVSYLENDLLESVLENAKNNSVSKMIAVGTHFEDWPVYLSLAKKFENVIYYSIGLHPCYVGEDWRDQIQLCSPYFSEEILPVAIGEIGLDYFHLPEDGAEREILIKYQKEAFKLQLDLAYQYDVPVIIHSRNAFEDCVEIIDASNVDWKKIVFHCFAEGPEEIAVLNEKGGRGSFTGIITYKKAENVRQAALRQGVDLLMLETDAPYLAPVPHRGKENEPAYTLYIAQYCAQLFDMSFEDFTEKVYQNTKNFFNLKD